MSNYPTDEDMREWQLPRQECHIQKDRSEQWGEFVCLWVTTNGYHYQVIRVENKELFAKIMTALNTVSQDDFSY